MTTTYLAGKAIEKKQKSSMALKGNLHIEEIHEKGNTLDQ
jgi:hypothetical protein